MDDTFIHDMFMSDMCGAVAIIIGLCLLVPLYFVPTIVAKFRKHKNSLAVFILNLTLGWTGIGWIIALVWAVKHEKI